MRHQIQIMALHDIGLLIHCRLAESNDVDGVQYKWNRRYFALFSWTSWFRWTFLDSSSSRHSEAFGPWTADYGRR